MAQHGDGAVGHHGQRLHVRGEGVNLAAVYFVTDEGARKRVNRDIFRLDIAGGLKNLLVERCRLHFAAARRGTQYSVFAEQGQNIQPAVSDSANVVV
jgi:hypothetical protein